MPSKPRVIWKIWVPFLCPKCGTKGRTEAHISRCTTIVKKEKAVRKDAKDAHTDES
jgi:predicted RNA-binding Zn-ribbon protein involved in translation (DUF1610 family)